MPPRHNKPGTPAPERASPSSGAQKVLNEMTFDFRSKIEVDQKKISALSSLYDNGFGCIVNLSYPSLLITLYVIYATVYPESHMV